MNNRAWSIFVIICTIFGGVAGWSLRVHTTNDRFLVSMAERYSSEHNYFAAQASAYLAGTEAIRNTQKTGIKENRKK